MVLFSIYTDIRIDFVIDSAFCFVILVVWLYHNVFICLDPSGQRTTTTTTTAMGLLWLLFDKNNYFKQWWTASLIYSCTNKIWVKIAERLYFYIWTYALAYCRRPARLKLVWKTKIHLHYLFLHNKNGIGSLNPWSLKTRTPLTCIINIMVTHRRS